LPETRIPKGCLTEQVKEEKAERELANCHFAGVTHICKMAIKMGEENTKTCKYAASKCN